MPHYAYVSVIHWSNCYNAMKQVLECITYSNPENYVALLRNTQEITEVTGLWGSGYFKHFFDRRGYSEYGCDVTNANTTPEACADINDLHCTTWSDTLQQCQTQENQT